MSADGSGVDVAERPTAGGARPRARDLPRRTPDRWSPGTLKLVLRVLDVGALFCGWWLAFQTLVLVGAATPGHQPAMGSLAAVGISASLLIMASKRLWLARVCSVRSAELAGLGMTVALSVVLVLAVVQLVDYDSPDRFPLLAGLYSFMLLAGARGAYAAWLRRARRQGRLARRLVVVGSNRHTRDIVRLIDEHPEAGYSIVGLCGPSDPADGDGPDIPRLGDHRDAVDAVASVDATGALVVASAFEPNELNATLRTLLRSGCHVHLSSGLRGIAHDRLLPSPLAREPLFYVEQISLTRSQRQIKRGVDLFAAGLLAVLVLPVVLVAALAIKLHDGGPVLFRQLRVGHDGKPFVLFKLRTMVPDAEARRAGLQDHNQRGGPLFKMVHDPRVTRVGRWLRMTSIDELPQLLNVIRGDMSLVGPRPALPEEVATFDDELRQRGTMLPGITGLWQVEARDDSSFDSYRRLDLYYVENWSIGLDLAIMLATVGAVTSRGVRSLWTSGTAA